MAIKQVEYRRKFQDLLRELFQLESAKDLDFGIYRILNYRRDVVERFIEKDLLDAVSTELERGALAEQAGAARDLEALAAKVRADLGDAALDANGVLADAYHDTPLGRKYLQLFELATGAKPRPEIEAAIFNHLYAFFSRYYDAGDFMSKRRYSKREKYAIPYNGEEVYLHWANRDQYYVKTAEHFTDYSFRAPGGVAVHFKLRAADVEKDNVKGYKRFFVPIVKDATFDAEKAEVFIPFEYRPLTAQEEIKYGPRNQQDAIIENALEAIPKHFAREAVATAAVADVGLHLNRYTARNTSDYFIHKDLKGFLERELDFYLKNEVINVDELEAGGEARTEAWFQQLRVIKAVGRKVIEFLAQVEDFQKMLFEKKKFILETQYCITVQNIPESFYPEIAANDAQWVEWQDLFHIEEEEKNLFNANAKSKTEHRTAFLKSYPTLVLDTGNFDGNFRERLLASYDDLDGLTDGSLIQAENFQALNLLREKYYENVKCIYIDPPYNKGGSDPDFLYKDNYKSSSWTCMIWDRLVYGNVLLTPDGVLFSSIDDNEFQNLLRIAQQSGRFRGFKLLPAITNLKGNYDAEGFVATHEYVMCATKGRLADVGVLPVDEEVIANEWSTDAYGFWKKGDTLRRTGADATRERRPKGWFPIFVTPEGDIYVTDDDNPLSERDDDFWPIDSKGRELSWTWSKRKIRENSRDLIVLRRDGGIAIYKKQRPGIGDVPTRKVKSFLYKPEYSSTTGGNILETMFGYRLREYTPKAVALIKDLVIIGTGDHKSPLILDYFAGSGTTGHAVINLNREDGKRREFCLVEIGEHFNTALLPRIKKTVFTPDWKNGKPARQVTDEEARLSPRIIKYISLEYYEDALNNIAFDDGTAQSAITFDDYVLKYMLSWETKNSPTFLNVAQLEDPFDYKLLVAENGVNVEKPVDLAETFNYLLGLHVATRRVYDDEGHKYLVYKGTTRDDRSVAVIWRATKGWTEAEYERDRAFVAAEKMTDGADDIYVNSDSAIPGARSLDPVFKARMFAPLDVGNGGT